MSTRWYFGVVAICLFGGLARGDDEAIKKTAKARAEECHSAILKGNYETFTNLMHPKAVELMGGKEKLAFHLTAEMKEMKARGVELKSFRVSDPTDPVAVGKELYLLVPAVLEMKVPDGRLLTDSTMLGVSADGGKTWVFVNAVKERKDILQVIPRLPDAIVLPKQKPPTLFKN